MSLLGTSKKKQEGATLFKAAKAKAGDICVKIEHALAAVGNYEQRFPSDRPRILFAAPALTALVIRAQYNELLKTMAQADKYLSTIMHDPSVILAVHEALPMRAPKPLYTLTQARRLFQDLKTYLDDEPHGVAHIALFGKPLLEAYGVRCRRDPAAGTVSGFDALRVIIELVGMGQRDDVDAESMHTMHYREAKKHRETRFPDMSPDDRRIADESLYPNFVADRYDYFARDLGLQAVGHFNIFFDEDERTASGKNE